MRKSAAGAMVHAVVPVKMLQLAKSRLAGLLTGAERRALVLAMLNDVLVALRGAQLVGRISVISRDMAALALAAEAGVEPLLDHADDLNGAIDQACDYVTEAGATAALVLPADLPLLRSAEIDGLVGSLSGAYAVVLAPSRDGGTNAVVVRPPRALPFRFGPGSLARHLEAARARGLGARLYTSPGLQHDLDRPDDLLAAMALSGATATQRLLRDLDLDARDLAGASLER